MGVSAGLACGCAKPQAAFLPAKLSDMSSVLRIIDANANRAREALRVMEDAARFLLNDANLSESLKHLRHDLAAALAPLTGLEANRDTPGDVGTTVRTASEYRRESPAQVVIAAGKRLGEALRTMEEYGKTLGQAHAGFAPAIESLRYRGYDIEQRLNRAMGSGRRNQWRVCVLVTESLCAHHDWLTVARLAWEAGADCVQLREKNLPDGELLRRVRQLADLPSRGTLIVNDRPDIALLGGADGVHVGQDDLPVTEVRKLVGGQLLIGVSTSRIEEAHQALRDGADYCGVGPMFPTTTKHKDRIVGPDYLRQFVAWGGLPHLAIGGIQPDNVAQLVEVGGRGVAVSSCVCAAQDPAVVVGQLLEKLGSVASV